MAALTPIVLQPDAMLRLHAANPKRYPVLLQSAARGEPLGRYDILFACPGDRLTLFGDGRLETPQGIQPRKGFLSTFDAWFERDGSRSSTDELLPFTGGWFVLLHYELVHEIESTLTLPLNDRAIAHAIRMPAAIIQRHADGAAWIVEEGSGNQHTPLIRKDLDALIEMTDEPQPVLRASLTEDEPQQYIRNVNVALEHIAAGNFYQANLSRAWCGQLAAGIRPHHIYRRLRKANPAPFAALAVIDNYAVISSSPERLIEVRNGIASTRPIAGTRPRRTDHTDDAERRIELHSHPKERAEHVMLIDLERNDLGRICKAGTVEVNEFMTVESYAHVHHIVSNVRGVLREDVTPGQCIAAVFPGGTITGCPKVSCMQTIADLERVPRGAYTGSMGFINLDGSMDLNILIRTLEFDNDSISFRAGAGIVADSIPERELEETRAKARGLINALEH